jgi:hypothetical protein
MFFAGFIKSKGSSLRLTLYEIFTHKIMNRPLKIEYPGAWYHVMNWGRHGEILHQAPEKGWLKKIGREFHMNRI